MDIALIFPSLAIIRGSIAAVWLYEGLWCKIFGRVQSQVQVVTAVPRLGPRFGRAFLSVLGVVEVAGTDRNRSRHLRTCADSVARGAECEWPVVGAPYHPRSSRYGHQEHRFPSVGLGMRRDRAGPTVKLETAGTTGRLGSSSGPHRLLSVACTRTRRSSVRHSEGKGRVFCIASAGATALRLADRHEVVACDINPIQLAYAERRARGAAVEIGDAERVMNFARAFMPLVGWQPRVVRAFLALSDVTEQMPSGASISTRGASGLRRRDVAFDSPRRVCASIRLRPCQKIWCGVTETAATRPRANPNATSPYASALLLGENSNDSISPETHIRFVLGDAASCLESCPPRFFDGFALSYILDGAEPLYCERLSRAVRHAGRQDAVVVWRSSAACRGTGEPCRTRPLAALGRGRSMQGADVLVLPPAHILPFLFGSSGGSYAPAS